VVSPVVLALLVALVVALAPSSPVESPQPRSTTRGKIDFREKLMVRAPSSRSIGSLSRLLARRGAGVRERSARPGRANASATRWAEAGGRRRGVSAGASDSTFALVHDR